MAEPASSDTGPISPGAVRAGHRRSTACAWWMRSGPKFLAKLHTTVKYTVDPIERAVLEAIQRRDVFLVGPRSRATWTCESVPTLARLSIVLHSGSDLVH